MRAFIAISLPQEIRAQLAKIQEQLKTSGADVKWVEPKNTHITLKFLGERNDKKINEITAILKDCAKGKKEFNACLAGIGAFPEINSPRVIWVSLSEGKEEIKQIAQDLEERTAGIGIPKEEKNFTCHITIGRMRPEKNTAKLIEKLKLFADKKESIGGRFSVKKITLYKSTLSRQGPLYQPLKEASLITT